MQNWVLTNCGKRVSFKDDSLIPMSWRLAQETEETNKVLKKFDINQEHFDRKTPSVGDVEDAIVSQLPIYLIENSHTPLYIIQTANFSTNKLTANCSSIQLKIPEGCWEEINVEEKFIEALRYLAHQDKTGNYYNDFDERINLKNNDVFLMGFYKEWLIFYRVYKTVDNTHKILSTVMKNSNSLCKDIKEMTYSEKTIHVEHKYRTVTSKNSKVVILGNMKIRNGWLESLLIKVMQESPLSYVKNYA